MARESHVWEMLAKAVARLVKALQVAVMTAELGLG